MTTTTTRQQLLAACNDLLQPQRFKDYGPNGLQVEGREHIRHMVSGVTASRALIEAAISAKADAIFVHHGLFWRGQDGTVTGWMKQRLQLLLQHDINLLAYHLPLDAHETFGNSALLARELGLTVSGGFAKHQHIHCGVRGEADLDTSALIAQVTAWAEPLGHHTVASRVPSGHRTRKWAICSGAGAQVSNLREAYESGVDTLIVGEGPHWSAIDAEEQGVVIIYAGHYATETLGVRALAAHLSERYALPWTFLHAPTGL